jgi:hypothetical protein
MMMKKKMKKRKRKRKRKKKKKKKKKRKKKKKKKGAPVAKRGGNMAPKKPASQKAEGAKFFDQLL